MKITVKVLNGQECTIAASPSSVVRDVKEQVEALLAIPVAHQKLLYKGKALLDERPLKDYVIEEGCKLTLVVKKPPVSSRPDSAPVTTDSNSMVTASTKLIADRPAWVKMLTFLRRHFCEKDALAVLVEFKKDFERNLSSLSLDDIERLAISKLRQA